MRVFISWSGPRSHAVAETLHYWLPQVINAVQPWLSSSDIEKGARWSTDVALGLSESKVGILCVTPENVTAPWLLFEAGALSKVIAESLVCPLLIDIEPTDITGPLAQFQQSTLEKEELRKLVHTVNSALGNAARTESQLDDSFDVWWPKLEERLGKLPPPTVTVVRRGERELLEETLSIVRSLQLGSAVPQFSSSTVIQDPISRQADFRSFVTARVVQVFKDLQISDSVGIAAVWYRLEDDSVALVLAHHRKLLPPLVFGRNTNVPGTVLNHLNSCGVPHNGIPAGSPSHTAQRFSE